MVLKSLSTTFDRLQLSGRPIHEWHGVEVLDDDDLLILATAIVLQAGDPKPDGGKYTAEEIESLATLWAARHGDPKGTKGRLVGNPGKGETDGVLADVRIVAFGMSGDKDGLTIEGCDTPLPSGCWFVQLAIGNERGTASKVVGDKRTYNGLAATNARTLLTKAAPASDEATPREIGQYVAEVIATGLESSGLDVHIDPTDAEDVEYIGGLAGDILDGMGLDATDEELDSISDAVLSGVVKALEVEVDEDELAEDALAEALAELDDEE